MARSKVKYRSHPDVVFLDLTKYSLCHSELIKWWFYVPNFGPTLADFEEAMSVTVQRISNMFDIF